MCLPYPSLSPHQPSSDEEEGERQSPPLEVSDGEADGLEPVPGLLHGETGKAQPQALTLLGPALCALLSLVVCAPSTPQLRLEPCVCVRVMALGGSLRISPWAL